MAVSDSQLETWAGSPSSAKLQFTHEQIRKALDQSIALRTRQYDIYLQGSYANSTNIRGDSDVDVVIQLNSTFNHDISKLSADETRLFHQTYPNATYRWTDFRSDVIKALEIYFPGQVLPRKKSVKVAGDNNRVAADVVPALQHRQYNSFQTWKRDDFVEGMKFWTLPDNKEITNYPKPHKNNGENKNAEHRTNENYKKVVRIFKNMKRQLVERHSFDPKVAPSYFIECMIYNTPDGHFANRHSVSVEQVLDFVFSCNTNILLTASHQQGLFGPDPWQWNTPDASNFFQSVRSFYNSQS